MKQELFVYGTLYPDRAPKGISDLVKKMVLVGSGTITGILHDLGEYPAVTLDGANQKRARGTVFALPDDPEILQRLDDYEGYLPGNPTDSLFVREKLPVTFDDGTTRLCWVYIYNRNLA